MKLKNIASLYFCVVHVVFHGQYNLALTVKRVGTQKLYYFSASRTVPRDKASATVMIATRNYD